MKLPNGYGGIAKLSGKRRNPWRVRVTKGWSIDEQTGKAKQLFSTLGYYPTRKDALAALSAYNQNPYDIETNTITFAEVYKKWSDIHFQEIVPSAARTWVSAYNHSKPLWDMRMKDIRSNHLEGTIRDATVGQSTKQRMKSLYNMMYKYAMKTEIVDKNYAQLCDSVKPGKSKIIRIPFSDDEITSLWNNISFPFANMVLVGIYSGWRPQELSILKVSDIDLEKMCMTGGIKSDAGKNRTVPIHSKIQDLVTEQYNLAIAAGAKTLFFDETSQTGINMTYDKYRSRFKKVMVRFNMTHTPHDTRHTFITNAKSVKMNEYILKLLVGHEIKDVTEKVYTHRTLDQLKEEIELIQ